jgi:hypothetical protein
MTRVSRPTALAVLVALVAVIGWGLAAGERVPERLVETDENQTDGALYEAIVDRMTDGAGYYAAVAAEQPSRGYPTSPTMTVREPVLAWVTAAVGPSASLAVVVLLAAVVLVLAMVRLEKIAGSRAEWYAATVLTATGLMYVCLAGGVWSHEVVAGLLVALGAFSVGARRWWVAPVAVTAAAAVRELAAPVLAVLAVLAWRRGERREAAAYVAGLAAWAAFYLWHVWQVRRSVPPSDEPSGGWLDVGGWPFVLNATVFSTPLSLLPFAVAAIVVPLALLGWVHHARRALTVVAVLVTFVLALGVVGRPNNLYWGAMYGVLVLPGLALAPRAVRDLFFSGVRA